MTDETELTPAPSPALGPETVCARCGGIVVNRGGREACASWVCVLRAWQAATRT